MYAIYHGTLDGETLWQGSHMWPTAEYALKAVPPLKVGEYWQVSDESGNVIYEESINVVSW